MKNKHGRYQLFACLTVILILWGVILPWVGSLDSVQSSIQFMNQRGIDPSAMYYTELDIMPQVQGKLDQARQEHPEAFWPVSSSESEPSS